MVVTALVVISCLAMAPLAIGQSVPEAVRALGDTDVIARSSEGRDIIARRFGPGHAPIRVVVIGQVHGDEPAGVEVVAALASLMGPQAGTSGTGSTVGTIPATIWLIDSLNPDGRRQGARVNAGGVDLNRNFPASWLQAAAGTGEWSGPAPASEVEVRGLITFLERVRPTAVVVLHQDLAAVDITHARSRQAGRYLARLIGLAARPVGCHGRCHGTLTEWVDQELGSIALTVELPGEVLAGGARRTAEAILAFAAWLARTMPR